MISREGAPAMRQRTQRRENRELVVSQGWHHFVLLCEETLWTQDTSRKTSCHSHVRAQQETEQIHMWPKVDATGLEKHCSWETLLIISSSVVVVSLVAAVALSICPLLFVFVIVCCDWEHIHPGDAWQLTYILGCWRLMTENRNSPEKHVDGLAASTNAQAERRSTRLASFSARYRLPLKNLERFANACAASPPSLSQRVLFGLFGPNLRLAPPSGAHIIISVLFSRGLRSSQCNNPPTLHWTRCTSCTSRSLAVLAC